VEVALDAPGVVCITGLATVAGRVLTLGHAQEVVAVVVDNLLVEMDVICVPIRPRVRVDADTKYQGPRTRWRTFTANDDAGMFELCGAPYLLGKSLCTKLS
jgi:hypothetical protein